MQVWYYTNLIQLKLVYNVNNMFYVSQNIYKFYTYKFNYTRKPCKNTENVLESLSNILFFVIKLLFSHVETWFIALVLMWTLEHSNPHICIKHRTHHRVLYRTIMDVKPPFHQYISFFFYGKPYSFQDKDNF